MIPIRQFIFAVARCLVLPLASDFGPYHRLLDECIGISSLASQSRTCFLDSRFPRDRYRDACTCSDPARLAGRMVGDGVIEAHSLGLLLPAMGSTPVLHSMINLLFLCRETVERTIRLVLRNRGSAHHFCGAPNDLSEQSVIL